MKKYLLIPVISLVLIGIYLARPTQTPVQPVLAIEQPQTQVVEEEPEIKLYTAQELLEITNEIRSENNVAPLVLDENLNRSASLKLEEMTRENNFEHVSSTGKHGYTYITDTTDYCHFGSENLMRVTPYVDAIKDYEGSESHWGAINNPDYEAVGFAMNNRYSVMHFCDKDPN